MSWTSNKHTRFLEYDWVCQFLSVQFSQSIFASQVFVFFLCTLFLTPHNVKNKPQAIFIVELIFSFYFNIQASSICQSTSHVAHVGLLFPVSSGILYIVNYKQLPENKTIYDGLHCRCSQ